MKVEELTAKILEQNPNTDRYQLALAVSKRADQLTNGAPSKLSVNAKKMKASDLALMELAEGLITISGFIEQE